jgi:hypothetical protein
MKTLIAMTLMAAGSALAGDLYENEFQQNEFQQKRKMEELERRISDLEARPTVTPDDSYHPYQPTPEDIQRWKDIMVEQQEKERHGGKVLQWWIEFNRHTSIPAVSQPITSDQH